jgi:hypothetical protein
MAVRYSLYVYYARAAAAARGHPNVIPWSAPAHATLAQPAAGADAMKDLRAQRAHEIRRKSRPIS